MADAIVRLKVESQEYDSKLKRAADQMARMEQEVRRTGASFAYADKEEIAFVQSLGQMGTQAQSAKQKMREYTDALTSLTATYRAMSDEEKSSEFGKAMAASIDQIKVKAAELKDIMSDTQREITNLASDTSFTDGLNMMTRTIGASASAIVAWTGDSKEMEAVIKDLAKIGTTVAAVDQLTKAFQKQNLVLLKNPYVAAAAAVVALGVAIGKLIQKSQELDGVQKTLNEVQAKGRDNAAKEMAQIDTLNSILHDNTRSLEERKTALAEIQNLVPDYHGALTEEGNLINDNTGAIDDYIDSLQRAALAQAAFDKMVELQKKKMQQQVELQEKQKSLQVAQARNEKAQGEVVYAGSEMTQVYTQMDTSSAERAVQQAEADIRATNAEIDALRNLVKATDVSNATTITTTGKGGKTAATGGVTTKELNPLQEAQRKISELSTEALTADEERTEAIRQEIEGLQEQVAEYKKIQDYVQGISQESEQEGLEPVMNGPEMSAFEKLQQSIRIKLADQNFEVDQASLTNLMTVAIQNGINGLDGAFEGLQYQLAEGINIPDEAWEELTAQINEQLAALGIDPIKINFETGNIEKTKKEVVSEFDKMRESLDKMSTGIGAISTLGNSLGNLKGIGEDLASAFSGDMDAFDAMMTVFNSGISIFETVISVLEAITTLTKLSTALKGANATASMTEATTSVAAAGMEVGAETEKQVASGITTGIKIKEAIAGVAAAMASIPLLGPVLAIAAIGTVLAAILAATSKSNNVGKYASGGIIPGNSFSGDNLTANVNSGELILNRSQQDSIASQLQGGATQTVVVEGRISGKDILLSANNTNRAAGGSRGYYTKVK